MSAPDASEAWLDDIFAAVETDCKMIGWFDTVNGAEPKHAPPGLGLTCCFWLQRGPNPLAEESGLNVTSALLTFFVRVFQNMLLEPQDAIDPNVGKSVSALVRRWHDNYDFDLHPLVRNVDLRGMSGTRLSSVAGYEDLDGKMFRVMTITLPVIVNDVWPIGS